MAISETKKKIMPNDIRWVQRLNHLQKAFSQLKEAVDLHQTRPLSSIEQQGLIKSFEFTHELAWNVMKDFFTYQGNNSIMGSRDAVREAFSYQLVEDGEGWMEMIKSRNQTSHTYNESVAFAIIDKITTQYFSLFDIFIKKMEKISRA